MTTRKTLAIRMRTPKELGIRPRTHAALREFVKLVGAGKIRDHRGGTGDDCPVKDRRLKKFKMEIWACETVGCIGGWVEFLMREQLTSAEMTYLEDLTNTNEVSYDRIRVRHAARAAEFLLYTGDPHWDIAVE